MVASRAIGEFRGELSIDNTDLFEVFPVVIGFGYVSFVDYIERSLKLILDKSMSGTDRTDALR